MQFNSLRLKARAVPVALMATTLSLLILSACGGGGGSTPAPAGSTTPPGPSPIALTNGQAAQVVIGQTNFSTNAIGTGATSLKWPYTSPTVDPVTGQLYISDYGNNRTLVYSGLPTTNGAGATYAIGQNDLVSAIAGTSVSSVSGPQSPAVMGGKLFVADYGNNRVDIYSPGPTGSPGYITTVLGQTNMTTGISGGCTASSLRTPETVSAAGGKVVVADGGNNRVLIWNTVPTTNGQPADLVIGQPNMTTCTTNTGGVSASSINYAGGAWTDGTRLVAIDRNNNRVLIWKTFPTVNGQPADLVLGQTSMLGTASGVSATTMWAPYEGVYVSPAGQLFVTDSSNNRVLVWNRFPTTNGQAADAVLGQPNFTSGAIGLSATTLNYPVGVSTSGNHVLVNDDGNNRILVY